MQGSEQPPGGYAFLTAGSNVSYSVHNYAQYMTPVIIAPRPLCELDFASLYPKKMNVTCPPESEQDTPLLEENVSSCVICLSNNPVCVISPCHHKSLCCGCARTLTEKGTKLRGEVKCPICKADVKKIFKVFE